MKPLIDIRADDTNFQFVSDEYVYALIAPFWGRKWHVEEVAARNLHAGMCAFLGDRWRYIESVHTQSEPIKKPAKARKSRKAKP